MTDTTTGTTTTTAVATGSVPSTNSSRNPPLMIPRLSKHLCLAMYYPTIDDDVTTSSRPSSSSSSSSFSSSPIWWPALKFDSVSDFTTHSFNETNHRFFQTDDLPLEWRNSVVLKVMKEDFDETPLETLCYLGRPILEYKTADDDSCGSSSNTTTNGGPIQVQEYWTGIVAVNPTEYSNNPNRFPTERLYLDYHRALDMATVLLGGPDSQSWLRKGEERWRTTPPDQRQYQPAAMANNVAEEVPSPQGVVGGRHRPEELGIPPSPLGGQSVAAVSCTEDSLFSNHSTRGGGPRNRPPSPVQPPRLTGECSSIEKTDTFDHVWHKFEYDGWEMYRKEKEEEENEDNDDDGEEESGDSIVIIRAPNNYEFPSRAHFLQHLEETYGWTEPTNQPQRHNNAGNVVPTSRRANNNKGTVSTDNRSDTAQQRLSRRQVTLQEKKILQETNLNRKRGKGDDKPPTPSGGLLLRYLTTVMGWTYVTAPKKTRKDTPHSWHYYKPGFSNKNMGELGEDYFQELDDVVAYCYQHGIRPPSSPDSTSAEEESGASSPEESDSPPEHEDPTDEDEDDEDDDHSVEEEDDNSETTGYETPMGQKSRPQDPSKPIPPSPPVEIPDDEKYMFANLWHNILQPWGWTMKRPPKGNNLDDWWFFKPAERLDFEDDGAHRGDVARMEEGVDYFTSEEAVVSHIKERDAALELRKDSKKRAKNSDRVPKKKTDRSVPTKTNNNNWQTDKVQTNNKGRVRTMTKERRVSSGKKGSRPLTDEDIKVEPSTNTAPWEKYPPLPRHGMCERAVGITYSGGGYRLPGNIGNTVGSVKSSVKYDDIMSIVRVLAQAGECRLLSGGTEPANDDERGFVRLLRYAFVPGKYSDWREIRMINASQAKELLQLAGYRLENKAKDIWIPPAVLVRTNVLAPQYDSLSTLCDALRNLKDLSGSGSSRKRNREEGEISEIQMLALRLYIAEGTISQESVDMYDESSTDLESAVTDDPERLRGGIDGDEHASLGASSPKRLKRKDPNDEQSRIAMTPDSIKVKFQPPDENPAPWKVNEVWAANHHLYVEDMGIAEFSNYFYYLKGEPRTAATKFTCVEEMRKHICTQGDYSRYLRTDLGKDELHEIKRHFNYAHVPGHRSLWKTYRKLKLSEVIKLLGLLGYERGPDGWWVVPKGVPVLTETRYETLSQLGKALVRLPDLEDRGEKLHRRAKKDDSVLSTHVMIALRLRIAEGLEDLPDGGNIDEDDNDKYNNVGDDDNDNESDEGDNNEGDDPNDHEDDAVFEEPNNEDAEERCPQGNGNKVQPSTDSEKANDNLSVERNFEHNYESSLVHNDCDMSNPYEPGAEAERNAVQAAENAKEEALGRFLYVCNPKDVWRYLRELGCWHSGHRYHLPRSGDTCEDQNQLVQYILNHSVAVLDFNDCSLSAEDLRQLEWYLRCVNAKIKSYSPLSKAYDLINTKNIRRFLDRIGIQQLGDEDIYKIPAQTHFGNHSSMTKTIRESELVNLIRKTIDLASLDRDESSPKRRRCKVLEPEEELALRLWAAQVDYPLTNFPVADAVGTIDATSPEETMDLGAADIMTAATSVVMDEEEAPIFGLREEPHAHGSKCESDPGDKTSVTHKNTTESSEIVDGRSAAVPVILETKDLGEGRIAATSMVMDVEENPIVGLREETKDLGEAKMAATLMVMDVKENPIVGLREEFLCNSSNRDLGTSDSSNSNMKASSTNNDGIAVVFPPGHEEATTVEIEESCEVEITPTAVAKNVEKEVSTFGVRMVCHRRTSSGVTNRSNAPCAWANREMQEGPTVAAPLEHNSSKRLSTNTCQESSEHEGEAEEGLNRTERPSMQTPERKNVATSMAEEVSTDQWDNNSNKSKVDSRGEAEERDDRTNGSFSQTPQRKSLPLSTASTKQDDSNLSCSGVVGPREDCICGSSKKKEVINDGSDAIDLCDQRKKLMDLTSPLRVPDGFGARPDSTFDQRDSNSMVVGQMNEDLEPKPMPPNYNQPSVDDEEDEDVQIEETDLDLNDQKLDNSMRLLYTQPSNDCESEADEGDDDNDIQRDAIDRRNGDFYVVHDVPPAGKLPNLLFLIPKLKEGYSFPPVATHQEHHYEQFSRDDTDIVLSLDLEKRQPWEDILDTTSRELPS